MRLFGVIAHASFHCHPERLSSTCLRFHPHRLPLILFLSLALSFSELLAPRILLEPHPYGPWLLKIDEPQNITHSHRPTKSTHDVRLRTECVRTLCARVCVCHRLSLPPQMLCGKPVSRGHSQCTPQPLWQPDLAALRKLHPATQTTHQPQQRFCASAAKSRYLPARYSPATPTQLWESAVIFPPPPALIWFSRVMKYSKALFRGAILLWHLS